ARSRTYVRILVVQIDPRTLGVDLVAQFGRLGEDGDTVLGHRQEAAVHRRVNLSAVDSVDAYDLALFQLSEHRDVPGQNPDLALSSARHHKAGLTGPELALHGDQLHRHLGH